MPRIAVIALVLGIAACSGPAGSSPAGPTPTPSPGGTACPPLAVADTDPITMPANGATGVATTIGSVSAPNAGQVAAGVAVQLTTSSGAVLTGGVFAAGPGGTAVATIPVLAPNTTYTVSAYATPPCTVATEWVMGSFTTGPS